MTLQDIYNQFIDNIQNTIWQEWVSTITQIASVWYARKNNVLVYPTGIIGVLLAFWIYYFIAHPPLYADGILNIYYFSMSVYGWYNWTRKTDTQEDSFPISWCTRNERLVGIIGFVLGWIAIFLLLKYCTDSNTPHLDALVSSTAVTAMWWMAKRKIESWHAWILSNIVAIPLNFYKELMLFSLMYVLLLVLAYLGYRDWKREIDAAHASA